MTSRRESDVTVTLDCNNNCLFCPREALRRVLVPEADLRESLTALREKAESVVLTGGEATILKDFLEIVSFCRSLKFKSIGVVTNGRMFALPGFARKALQAGLSDAAVSIYSHRPREHDRITRVPGSCLESWLGLARALAASHAGRRLRIRANVVVSAYNLAGAAGTIRKLLDIGIASLLLIDPLSDDDGACLADYSRIRRLLPALAADPRLDAARVVLRGFPACALGPRAFRKDWGWEALDVETTPGHDPADMQEYRRRVASRYRRIAACGGCARRGLCPGFQAAYLDRFGVPAGLPANGG